MYKINNDVTLAFGASMITGMATDKIHSPDGNPNAYLNMYWSSPLLIGLF